MTIWLILQGILGLLWAAQMFITLFALRRRAVAMGHGPFPGPYASIAALRDWWGDPAARRDRRRLGALTLALILATLGFSVTR